MAGSLKRKIVCAVVAGLTLLCIVWYGACCMSGDTGCPAHGLSLEEQKLLREGDLIFRRGDGILSRFIVRQLNDTISLSHCGILVREQGQWQVIHSLSSDVSETDGVQQCSLDDFTDESIEGSLYVLRCRLDSAGLMAAYARYYLRKQKPFDRQFDLSDTTSFFCSELPYRILKDHLHRSLQLESGELKFSAFFDSVLFHQVFPVTAHT